MPARMNTPSAKRAAAQTSRDFFPPTLPCPGHPRTAYLDLATLLAAVLPRDMEAAQDLEAVAGNRPTFALSCLLGNGQRCAVAQPSSPRQKWLSSERERHASAHPPITLGLIGTSVSVQFSPDKSGFDEQGGTRVCGEAYMVCVAAENPQTTPLIEKRAIYGWTLASQNQKRSPWFEYPCPSMITAVCEDGGGTGL